MKDEILKLRSEGKSYKFIQRTLGCALSTISYHCSPDVKQKSDARNAARIRKTSRRRKITIGRPVVFLTEDYFQKSRKNWGL